ncbi:MAG TPA: ATP-binding protein [Candidatus Limnocylindrales bacterium]|nr:ATP-binding protein [Candidatus Limnocylindrales bacterium]
MKQEGRRIVFSIPGETDYLIQIRSLISKVASEAGLAEEELYKVETAVDEACANVIEHAYEGEKESKPIQICLEVTPSRLVVSVKDYGKTFNPGAIKPPDLPKLITEKRDGGLGLFLLQSLMDEINYTSDPWGYNQLTMIKYLKPKQRHGPDV